MRISNSVNLTDELIWTKAMEDTVGLESFYERNKDEFRWEKRLDAVVYNAQNEEIAKNVKEKIRANWSADSILTATNAKSMLNLKYTKKKFEKGENEFVDQVKWEKGISENIKKDGRVFFVHAKEVLGPTYKTLEDSRGLITSKYQEYLEKQWIEQLRKKYQFTINDKVLNQVKKELN